MNNSNFLTYAFFSVAALGAAVNWYVANRDQVNDLVNKFNDEWNKQNTAVEEMRTTLGNTFPSVAPNNGQDGGGNSPPNNVVGGVSPESNTSGSMSNI